MITLEKDPYLISTNNPQKLYYKEIVPSGNGETVLIKPNAKGQYAVSVAIEAGSNTGKVQYTIDTEEEIQAGTEVWYDWPKGNISGNAIDSLISPVSAIRGVSISGSIILKVII